jgi:pteridine reductase
MNMSGKTIIITGGARRVGAAIARTVHARGANLLVHHRNSHSAAEALLAECNAARPGSAAAVALDFESGQSLQAVIDRALDAFGRIDALVNNASTFYPTPLGKITEADWHTLLASNLKAPLFLSQAAAPHLKKTGGVIVNLVDIHAERPMKDFVVYSLAKAGLVGLTRSLALELAPEVRVNGVAPGPIDWPDTQEQARILESTPLKREGGVEAIAKAVAFLVSSDADYVTGQILAVDGGRSIYL